MIDTGLYAGFEIPEGKTLVQTSKIVPCDFETPIRTVFCDIETYSKGRRFPLATDSDAMVTINCMYDSFTKEYLTIIVGIVEKTTSISENHRVMYVKNEETLLKQTLSYLNDANPDIFTAWNVGFDKDYLDERAKKHGIVFPWNTMNVFDLLGAYKKLYAKSNNELRTVVFEEKLGLSHYQPFAHDMWEKSDLTEAIRTNQSHVEAIVKINEKKRLTDFFWDLKRVAGVEDLSETLYHGKLVDALLSRHYYNKWIIPSKPNREEITRRKQETQEKVGGFVLTPPFGLFQNVGVFDMSRYYPEMLIAQNLSPEPHARNELGIVPKMTLDLIETRLRYDRELQKHQPGSTEYDQVKHRRNSVKYITESVIGYFGSEPSRLFDLDIFNSVTKMGQRGVSFLQKICNREGNAVLYIDTDGLTIKVSSIKAAIENVDKLNNSLKEFCRAEGIKRELTLKLDRFFSWIIFKKIRERIDGKWVERGAKKRYAGIVTYEDGKDCNYLKIVGFEYVRRDSPPLTKEIQKKVFGLVFSGKKDEVAEYLKDRIADIRARHKNRLLGLDEIAIPVTLNQSLSSYGGKNIRGSSKGTPDYARGAIYSNEWLGTEIRGGDQVKMLYLKRIKGLPQTDVVCYLNTPPANIDIDLDRMLDRIVKQKIEDVIDVIGISWDDVFSRKKNLFEE